MRDRIFTIVAVLVMVAAVAGGWFLAIGPQLAVASEADSQRGLVEAQNAATAAAIAALAKEQEDLPDLETTLSALQRAIPLDIAAPAFIDDINALAIRSGVVVSAITVATPLAYVAPAGEAPEATTDEASGEADTAEAPVVEIDPNAPPAVTNGLVTSDNFVLIPVTIEAKGTYAQALDFLNGLQFGERLFLVTGFVSSANKEDAGDPTVTATTTGYIYALKGQYDLDADSE